jgi:hypothetical protein
VVGERKKESLLNPPIVDNVGIEDSEDLILVFCCSNILRESFGFCDLWFRPAVLFLPEGDFRPSDLKDFRGLSSDDASTRRILLLRGVVGERKKESLLNPPIVSNVGIEDSEDLILEFCSSNVLRKSFGVGVLWFRPAVLFLPEGDFGTSDLRDFSMLSSDDTLSIMVASCCCCCCCCFSR